MYNLWHQRQRQRRVAHARRRSLSRFLRATLFHWTTLLFLFFSVLIALFLYAAVTYVTFANDLVTPERIMNRNNRGIILFDRDGRIFYRSTEAKDFHPISLDTLPPFVIDATIAAEDAEFFVHPGFSIRGVARSIWKNVLVRDPFRFGGSTITQQLVKNLLVGQERTFRRKVKELILAIEIERRFTKNEILEMYLNSIYYGSNAFGIAEAARVYFGKDAEDLTLAEASLLAGIPNAQSYLSPHTGSLEASLRRQQYVLRQMREHSFITPEEEAEARSATLQILPPQTGGTISPHFALYVQRRLYELFEEEVVNQRGFRVYTTLDRQLQQIAEEEIFAGVNRLSNRQVSNGAFLGMNPKTGEILAMVGSADWYNDAIGGKFNAAVDGRRQPGSSFKPIVYLEALRTGLVTTTTILHDEPMDFSGYSPKNYDGRFRGEVTVRRALANSLNVPSVELMELVGVKNTLRLARNLGISTLTDQSRYGLSLVLGGGEVTLLELVGAYAAIADSGIWHEPYAIVRIEDKFGRVVYTHDRGIHRLLSLTNPPERSRRVVRAEGAYLITHILSDPGQRVEVFGHLLDFPRPAAIKTGTTDDFRDSWTVGYTPQLAGGVWIGNNDNTPMRGVSGALGAAPIWKAIMLRAHEGVPVEEFVRPGGIVEIGVCSGIFLRDDESDIREVYIRGTEPTEHCRPPEEDTPSDRE